MSLGAGNDFIESAPKIILQNCVTKTDLGANQRKRAIAPNNGLKVTTFL